MERVWYVCGRCMCEARVVYEFRAHGILTEHARNVSGACMEYAWICMKYARHAWKMHGLCMGDARNMHALRMAVRGVRVVC